MVHQRNLVIFMINSFLMRIEINFTNSNFRIFFDTCIFRRSHISYSIMKYAFSNPTKASFVCFNDSKLRSRLGVCICEKYFLLVKFWEKLLILAILSFGNIMWFYIRNNPFYILWKKVDFSHISCKKILSQPRSGHF